MTNTITLKSFFYIYILFLSLQGSSYFDASFWTTTQLHYLNIGYSYCYISTVLGYYSKNVIYYSLLVTPFKSNIVIWLITF